MIKIDMEMPRTCDKCILANEITSKYFACPVIEKAIPTGHKSQNCPLHPLDDVIRVGDEVCFNDGESFKGVVLDESVVNGSWCVLTENGCVSVFDEKKLHRTGRHFDEVETMLKKMRGEAE